MTEQFYDDAVTVRPKINAQQIAVVQGCPKKRSSLANDIDESY